MYYLCGLRVSEGEEEEGYVVAVFVVAREPSDVITPRKTIR
jgi:hypothetical protein